MKYFSQIESPIGVLTLFSNENALTQLNWGSVDITKHINQNKSIQLETDLLAMARQEIIEYFKGHRTEFTLPLEPVGTPFQVKVWNALKTIPYGETLSYQELARLIGNPKACRAVGGANKKNPIGLIIPCHRVIGASGKLTGFAGGIDVKSKLLKLEADRFR